jgi:hypothetical protein
MLARAESPIAEMAVGRPVTTYAMLYKVASWLDVSLINHVGVLGYLERARCLFVNVEGGGCVEARQALSLFRRAETLNKDPVNSRPFDYAVLYKDDIMLDRNCSDLSRSSFGIDRAAT